MKDTFSVLPRHIAIIMDGNGRWAAEHGLQRADGHYEGARRVVDFISLIRTLKIEYVTLYAFSTENWKRSKEEVSTLMNLLAEFLDENLPTMLENKIRLLVTGRFQELPDFCVERLNKVINATAENYEYTLVLALNYGGRAEILDSVKKLAQQVKNGEKLPENITEEDIAQNLYLPTVPDPDLLIRTSGEQRLSNFLLWELSYAEFYFTPVYWPDFNEEELMKALHDFEHRKRRFGGRP